MKKFLLLFLILGFNFTGAQCLIRGTSSAAIGTTNLYSIPSMSAQCTDCYYWTVTSGASITGSNTGNSVNVVANSTGTFSVSVTYFSNGVCQTCTKTINDSNSEVDCNNINGGISQNFFASTNNYYSFPVVILQVSSNAANIPGVIYNWSVTHLHGTLNPGPVEQNGLLAAFKAEQSNPITSATVIIKVPGCPDKIFTVNFYNPIYGDAVINGNKQLGRKSNIDKFITFPNPVKDEVYFKGENAAAYSVSIYDLNGKEVISKKPLNSAVSLEGQKKGIYKYVITGKDDYRQEGTLAKE